MFLAYYCNIGERLSEEQQADGILQTLLSQLKDHKGNLASITTGIANVHTYVRMCILKDQEFFSIIVTSILSQQFNPLITTGIRMMLICNTKVICMLTLTV